PISTDFVRNLISRYVFHESLQDRVFKAQAMWTTSSHCINTCRMMMHICICVLVDTAIGQHQQLRAQRLSGQPVVGHSPRKKCFSTSRDKTESLSSVSSVTQSCSARSTECGRLSTNRATVLSPLPTQNT